MVQFYVYIQQIDQIGFYIGFELVFRVESSFRIQLELSWVIKPSFFKKLRGNRPAIIRASLPTKKEKAKVIRFIWMWNVSIWWRPVGKQLNYKIIDQKESRYVDNQWVKGVSGIKKNSKKEKNSLFYGNDLRKIFLNFRVGGGGGIRHRKNNSSPEKKIWH